MWQQGCLIHSPMHKALQFPTDLRLRQQQVGLNKNWVILSKHPRGHAICIAEFQLSILSKGCKVNWDLWNLHFWYFR